MKDLCKKCLEVLPLDQLVSDRSRPKGYQNRCLKCLFEERNPGKEYFPRGTRKRETNYLARKRFLDEARSVPCADCGFTFHPCAMDFDHLGQKNFGIMNQYRNKTMEQLVVEIALCEVVCSNCHRVRTFNRR